MALSFRYAFLPFLLLSPLCAQAPAAPPQTLTLRSSQPLKTGDLTLTIGGRPQTILKLEAHTANPPAPPPLLLPPGTFADITPLAPGTTLNIVLLDALNTPAKSPAYLRSQLKQLTTHSDPSAPLAIFGLADHVILLQGFSSPRPLKDATDHKLIPRASAPSGEDAASPPEALLAANLQQFLVQAASVDAQLHPQRTLDALNLLAHYLAGLPGHKNLLWLSASFPDGLLADTATPATALNAAEVYETRALIASADVAVFPVDTHGLLPHAKSPAPSPSHASMEHAAEATGGQPFFDVTDLSATIASAIQAGFAYSTITYIAANNAPVSQIASSAPQPVVITAADSALRLAYPRASYGPPGKPAEAYSAAVMQRGAPAPSDVLFKVRVLPSATPPEPTVAPSNEQNPDYRVLGPFQRYSIDYITPGDEFTLTPQQTTSNGQPVTKYGGKIEFMALDYDINGRLLNSEGKSISLSLSPADHARLRSTPVSLHLELSVPTRQESYLRLAIRDTASGRMGVVELPASSVSQLPPAPVPAH